MVASTGPVVQARVWVLEVGSLHTSAGLGWDFFAEVANTPGPDGSGLWRLE